MDRNPRALRDAASDSRRGWCRRRREARGRRSREARERRRLRRTGTAASRSIIGDASTSPRSSSRARRRGQPCSRHPFRGSFPDATIASAFAAVDPVVHATVEDAERAPARTGHRQPRRTEVPRSCSSTGHRCVPRVHSRADTVPHDRAAGHRAVLCGRHHLGRLLAQDATRVRASIDRCHLAGEGCKLRS